MDPVNDTVRLTVEGGIALVTLNRPKQLNAINYAVLCGLVDAVKAADADLQVGCIVVTGAGRGFCAGGDLKEGARAPKDLPAGLRVSLRDGVEACRVLRESAKPTIAMVNGPVAGAGIGIAGACDLRFAGESATFLSAFDRIGGGGDYGATYVWTRALGAAKARELFLMGESFTARGALAFGLYTRLFPDDDLAEQTMAAARRLADGPRPGWGYMKNNLNAAETEVFTEHLTRECRNMGQSIAASQRYLKAKRQGAEQG
jgi:2-(1,2-epoxy-1,2-dihydrophenyl)acetyl-CoA isomerase